MEWNDQPDVIRVFPVPTESRAYIELFVPAPAHVELEIFNVLGQTTGLHTYDLSAGSQQLEIDLSAYADGIYTGQLFANGIRIQEIKLVVQR